MDITKHLQILRAPEWGLWWGDAGYFGRRWFLHVGPLHLIIWQLTEAQYDAWWDAEVGSRK